MLTRIAIVSLCCAWLTIPAESALGQVPKILGGQETDDYPSVGIVGSQRRGGFCSGTLISSTHVLTAAHCADVIESPTSGTFELEGQVYGTSDIFIHPNFNPVTLANDVAIMQLSEPVVGIEPSEIFRGTPLVGDLLIIVGYGATGTASGGSDGSFGTKRFGFTTIDEVTSTLINWVFDDASEMNTAPGDSGGPGFLDIDGELFVACITSGGTEDDASLGDMAFNTRVDAYADWIDETVLFSLPSDPPSDNEPPSDDPPTDPPSQDEQFDCDFLSGPFPLLRLLLHLIWSWLSDLLDTTDDLPPAEPEPVPTEPEPTVPEPAPTDPAPADPEPEIPEPTDPQSPDPGVQQGPPAPQVGASFNRRRPPSRGDNRRRSRNSAR